MVAKDPVVINGLNKRQFYRIVFPPQARPQITFNGFTCYCSEISEGGGRILVGKLLKPRVDFDTPATLTFPDGTEYSTRISFHRSTPTEIIVTFKPLITCPIILGQQRWLISRYSCR
jgi:hypothetical protein